jgi:hypothetical protein
VLGAPATWQEIRARCRGLIADYTLTSQHPAIVTQRYSQSGA